MKYWLLVSLIFLVSCTHYSTRAKREIASGFPARIVKILSPTKTKMVYKNNFSFKIEVVAYKYGTVAAKGRAVRFSIEEGAGKILDKSTYTDALGKASVVVEVKKYPIDIHVKIRIDNIIKNVLVEVIRPEKYIGRYSITQSKLFVSDNSVLGNGKEKIKFSLQLKDSKGKRVDAYGLSVSLINKDGLEVLMNEKTNGLYEKSVLMNFSKGTYKYGVKVEGQKLSSKVIVTIVPDIQILERFLISEKTKSGVYRVQFTAKTGNGRFIQSLDELDIRPVLNGPGTYSKIIYNKKLYRFEYTFYPPAKTGSTRVGVSYNGKNHWVSTALVYEYAPVDSSKIILIFDKKKVLPTGIDFISFTIEYRDESNQLINLTNKSQFPEFEVSPQGRVLEFKKDEKGIFHGKLQPAIDQRNLNFALKYEGKIIQEKNFDFDFKSIKEKLSLEDHINSMTYFNGFNFNIQNRGDSWKNITGSIVGFDFENSGGNDIIPNGCAVDSDSNQCQATREFAWEFSEQATQNMVMVVTDFPSDTLSKMMHGRFMFFPRKVVPSIRWSENKSKIIVTLPTNEKVLFDAKTKQIVGGVLEEGPIDLGPSRHTRKFPLIRYKGKGVVLRVNARGQDARLGNWNKTKISGDFGNTGAEGVMIYKYNTVNDKPEICRFAKKDFWPQKDISPIPFKYYSDKDFAGFLKSHCNFDLSLN